ncbi:hypothetical protein ACTXT7_001100 [Hymenolepis weldensis]
MVGRFVKVVSITPSYSLEHICAYRDLICVDEAAADLISTFQQDQLSFHVNLKLAQAVDLQNCYSSQHFTIMYKFSNIFNPCVKNLEYTSDRSNTLSNLFRIQNEAAFRKRSLNLSTICSHLEMTSLALLHVHSILLVTQGFGTTPHRFSPVRDNFNK